MKNLWIFLRNFFSRLNEIESSVLEEIDDLDIDKSDVNKPEEITPTDTDKITPQKEEKSKDEVVAKFEVYPKILYGYDVNDTIKGAPNFKIKNLLKSATAQRKKIRNVPTQQQFNNLLLTTRKILQPIRNHFGPVIVTSGFRCIKLCIAIGSTKNSNHARGEAVDFFVPGVSLLDVLKWINKNLEFRELIVESSRENVKSKKPLIIHCAYRKNGNLKILKHPVTYKPTTINEIEQYFNGGPK